MYLAIYFLCCRMAKQKRKVTEGTGKKNKKLKKVSAEETGLAPEAAPAAAGARPEVGVRGLALTSVPRLEGQAVASAGVAQTTAQVTRGRTLCPLKAAVGQIRIAVRFGLDSMTVFATRPAQSVSGATS